MPESISMNQLLALGRGADVNRFVTVASAALAQGVRHDELTLLLLRRLAEHGLLARARAVAAQLSQSVQNHPDFQHMRAALNAGSSDGGRMEWQLLRPRFEANIAALRARYVWTPMVARAWEHENAHFELYRTTAGRFEVFDTRSAGGWRPTFGNVPPEPTAAALARQFAGHVTAPLALEGVGWGEHLPWLHAATCDMFLGATPTIFVLEPTFVGLAVALHLVDWRELIAAERVHLCCGPDAAEQMARLVETDDWCTPPAMVFSAPPWNVQQSGLVQPCVRTLNARLNEQQAALRDTVRSLYQERDAAWWARRFSAALRGDEPPLRVLGITSRFTTVLQYSMRDALAALEDAGCQTQLVIEPNDHARLSPRRTLAVLRAFEPDLVLLIDHTRSGQRASLSANVPVVTWIQDRLPWLFNAETGAAFGPLDFCMGFAGEELTGRYGYPAQRFWPCEMATSPEAFWPHRRVPDNPPAEDARWQCDVAYATNHVQSPSDLFTELRTKCPPALRNVLEAAYDELLACCERAELNGGIWWEHFVEPVAQRVGATLDANQQRDLIRDYLRPLVDRLLRFQTIQWAANWALETGGSFRLYGHGWEDHPDFGRFAGGFVAHGPVLGAAVRGARINLHAGCNPARHQRVLDALAAGGFVLIRRHADDVGPALYRAMHTEVKERGLPVGQTVRWWELLPAPFDARFIEMRRMLGLEPFEEIRLTQQHIDNYRAYAAGKHVPRAIDIWPNMYDVTFGSQTEFNERVAAFLGNVQQRRVVAEEMREQALERYSYRALMRGMLGWLLERLDGRSPAQSRSRSDWRTGSPIKGIAETERQKHHEAGIGTGVRE